MVQEKYKYKVLITTESAEDDLSDIAIQLNHILQDEYHPSAVVQWVRKVSL